MFALACMMGSAAAAGSSPSLNPDDDYANAVLLLPMNDDGGGNVNTVDYSAVGRAMSIGAGVTWQTAIQKFYGGSASFDGTSGSWTRASAAASDLALGSGSWTIEFWYRAESGTPSASSIIQLSDGADTYSGLIGYNDGSSLRVYLSTSGGGWEMASGLYLGSVDTAAFHHYAVTYDGSNVWAHLDGAQVSNTTPGAVTVYQAQNQITVGKGQGNHCKGKVQDLRIYKGVAKYGASSFTPPGSILA